jgi:tetratricopeptide (TPR) repeat protein
MKPETEQAQALPAAAVRDALAQLEASRSFRGAARHRSLLRHLVTRLLAGDTAALKESVVAVQVFGRPPGSFDPVRDTIVRVEARRLRARLAAYHAGEGRGAALRIELPVGSYVPLLVMAGRLPSGAEATRRARDLVERGEHHLRQPLSRASLEAALERFDAALREAPDSAAACTGMGRAWLNLATGWYRDPVVASEHAAEALQRALLLDPSQPLAHTLLGALQNQFHRDWPAARCSFQRALDLAPDSAFVWAAWGCHLALRNQIVDAESALLRARELDPQYPNTRVHMVHLRIAQGRFADAQAEWAALADVAPDSIGVLGLGALLAYLRGEMAVVLAHYRRAAELMPDYAGCHAHVAGALALCGDLAGARAALAAIPALAPSAPQNAVSPYVMSIVALRMGDVDLAIERLQTAAEIADPNVLWALTDPCLDPLRDDARFAAQAAALRLKRRPASAMPAAPRRR